MACSTCSSSNTCTCTSVNSCESCIDILNAECVYYKGYLNNSLSLPANFRFNTFAEKVLERIGTLPANYVDYRVSGDSTLDFANQNASINQLKLVVVQDGLSDITLTTSLAKHACFVDLTSTTFAITGSPQLVSGQAAYQNIHTYDNDIIYIASDPSSRQGWQSVSAEISFYNSSITDMFILYLYAGDTLLKMTWVSITPGNYYTLGARALYNCTDEGTPVEFTVKISTDGSNDNISINSGHFEVIEYAY